MEHRISIYCPHCHKNTSLRSAQTHAHYGGHDFLVNTETIIAPNRSSWWIGLCNFCDEPVLVKGEGDEYYPTPLPAPTDKRIPEDLRKDIDEAKKCFSMDCYRACAVLCRRSIQLACLLKEAKKGKLEDQIKELSEKGIITKGLADWATVVRWIGNDAAHPEAPIVDREEADDCLKLAEQFLHVLFVTPSIAEERKKKRADAKGK